MGNCDSRRFRDISNGLSLKRSFQPWLRLLVTIWPLENHVNLKDLSLAITQQMRVNLLNGEKMKFNLNHQTYKASNQISPLQIVKQQSSEHQSLCLPCTIQNTQNQYKINFQFMKNSDSSSQIWLSAEKGTQLTEDDIYKIGNTQYRVLKYIRSNDYKAQEIQAYTKNNIESLLSIEDHLKKCRICYSTDQFNSNPFVNPCKCTGSIEFVHLQCLSEWLFGRISESTNFLSLKLSKLFCEICKQNITGKFRGILESQAYKSIVASILSGQNKIKTPFLILEGQFVNSKNQKLKNYMVLSFAEKKQYLIGRSSHADIFDKTDNYVSRINSKIWTANNKIFIKDCQSKHGTCLKIAQFISLDSKNHFRKIIYKNITVEIQYISNF